MEIRTFADFWPYYVRAHSQTKTRVLHAVGSVLAIVSVGLAFTVSLWFLLAVTDGPRRVRVQVWLDDGEPVPTVIEVWPTADWHEREAWDMMGIRFEGHPNLSRILMEDDWEGHPLRKDYPIGGEPVRFSGEE